MQTLQDIVQVIQVITAAAVIVFFLGAKAKVDYHLYGYFRRLARKSSDGQCLYGHRWESLVMRKRKVTSFVWTLVPIFIVSVVDCTIATLRASATPDAKVMAASMLYALGVFSQIDQLWSCESGLNNEHSDWHAYLGSWVAMILSDMLAVVKLALEPQGSPYGLICDALPVGLRGSLVFALLVMFDGTDTSPNSETLTNADDTEAVSELKDTMAVPKAGDQKGKPQIRIHRSVQTSIEMAGGVWSWIKKFHIFLVWLWPDEPAWMRRHIALAIMVSLGETVLQLYFPHAISDLVQMATSKIENGEADELWWPFAVPIVTALGRLSLVSIRKRLWSRVKASRQTRVVKSIQRHNTEQDPTFHDAISRTDIALATDKAETFCELVDSLAFTIMPRLCSVVNVVRNLVSLFGSHIAIIEAFFLAMSVIMSLRRQRRLFPVTDALNVISRKAKEVSQSRLRAWPTVFRSGQASRDVEADAEIYSKLEELREEVDDVENMYGFITTALETSGAQICLLLLARYRVKTDSTMATTISQHTLYFTTLEGDVSFFLNNYFAIFGRLSKLNELLQLMEIKPTMTYGTVRVERVQGRVELKGVSFSYPGGRVQRPLFKDLSLVFKAGETTGVVGATGVGKTTLWKIIARIYDPDEGSVELDRHDIKTLGKDELPKHVRVMPQTPELFDEMTIGENIVYGQPDAKERDVHDAAKKACIHDRIMSLDQKYDTRVMENAKNFSGGEAQRISLSRVFMAKPRPSVLVLDECTSALDADTEADVKKAITTDFSGSTIIIFAHRLSMVSDCQNVIVLEETEHGGSKVAEYASPSELITLGGSFARLWRKQISTNNEQSGGESQ